MPRSRYQFTEEDVPVVHRWVQAKLRDIAWPQHETARTAWEQSARAQPSAMQLHTRRVYVNDSDNIAGASALLDSLLSSGL